MYSQWWHQLPTDHGMSSTRIFLVLFVYVYGCVFEIPFMPYIYSQIEKIESETVTVKKFKFCNVTHMFIDLGDSGTDS
jgi:hypothetical protein